MYINGQTGAVQERMVIYKRPPHSLSVHSPRVRAAPRSSPDHVISDWPISDHMNSSKQDVTC
ncbi:unnamed protein product [Staurois parvus]|uniref:Uncharacterized protein n=1 Tax=Staurois parvus TaxID=386267 RepID=A0ABN9G590_9NEOB|nr:unnamed protein product [Staurois parvus]